MQSSNKPFLSMEALSLLLEVDIDTLNRQPDRLLGTLGIDSLAATRVREALSPKPSYQVLYGLSIAQVAARISTVEPLPQCKQLEESYAPFPLTQMQGSYVIGASQGCPCQVYTEIDVENLDVSRFQQAIRSVVERHSMLHAVIVDGVQQAIVTPEKRRDLAIDVLDNPGDLGRRRRECMDAFKEQSDIHWRIQLTRINERMVRIHLLLDMLFIDATSAMQLCKEVADQYRALISPEFSAEWAPTPLTFRDYCLQQTVKKATEASIAYWNSRCEWMPPPPQIPRIIHTDVQGVNFQREAVALAGPQWQALKQYAGNIKVTPNAVLLAAFAEALRFYAEEPEFTITVTMSERPVAGDKDFSNIVGEFTNVLLCPVGERLGNTINDYVIALHGNVTEGLEHSDVSGLEVVRSLRRQREDPQLTFPVVFTSFLGIVKPGLALENCQARIVYQQTQTPQITLDFQVYEHNGVLRSNWDYDANVYTRDLIKDMAHCYKHLLEGMADDNADCAMLPLEIMSLREGMNKTGKDFNPGHPFLLHELVLHAAQQDPTSIAVIDREKAFSYNQIVAMANAVAVLLQAENIGPGSCVAVVLEKGWEQVVATVGILLTGACYLPLNPSDPDERLRSIMSLADCAVALSHDKSMTKQRRWHLTGDRSPVTRIRIHPKIVDDVTGRTPTPVDIDPSQLAYIIFTSGSTGNPKGVEITHCGAVNTCLDINERFGLRRDTVTFGISSLSFDLSVWDIFGTLGAGGTLVVCKPDGTRDPDYWWQQLNKHTITVWNTVPTSFEMLIASRPPQANLPLKTVLLSGDAISMAMVDNALKLFPALKIVALGGATEASIWSNYHVVDESSRELETELVPYGRALSNQTIHVLDTRFNYRPAGVAGEIYIGGVGVARGYFRDAELTAEKFIYREPFGRLYATGDLGRYLPNGEIEIIGRKDSQVKIGGHRVELAEIEHCAESLPEVKRAAVVHIPGAAARVVAFVTADVNIDEGKLKEALRAHVAQKLPDYMAPHSWIVLEQIPLTANGKVDTRKLHQLAKLAFVQSQTSPSTIENSGDVRLILQLVGQVLDVPAESLSAHHSLSEQGLSSLYAVKLINLLSKAWNTRLSYTLVFNYPTAVQLANYRSGLSGNRSTVHAPSPDTLRVGIRLEPVAVIGQACRLPGDVNSPEEFWELLLAGRDCMTDVPASRFDIDAVYDPNPGTTGRSYTRRGAFISRVDCFDHSFFDISVAEARCMDPQQRLLLEVAYEAFYAAGYDKNRLRGSFTGVFVGQMNYDWMMDFAHTTDYAGTGSAPSITSNRISFCLDLAGPSMTIDTACSSSLVAVDTAVTQLRAGACRMALVGGVNLILSPEPYVTTCQARMLSVASRCATFDAQANGIARGEGVAAVVLKCLREAHTDGDPILATIRGTAVNQDGRSASLTAPNGLAQQAVIRQALNAAGLAGGDIDYVECHGTGTALGDPIEVEALKNVLGEGREKPVVLGAVKTNIGHLEGAAGIVGLIKTVAVLRHAQAPGNVHFKSLNPKINLDDFDALIPTKPIPLRRGNEGSSPLFASVSSFGYGGSNAHVVLESSIGSGGAPNRGSRFSLFRSVPLPWKKPVSKFAVSRSRSAQTSPQTVENCLYETLWIPSSANNIDNVQASAGPCLLISPSAIESELPPGWQFSRVEDEQSLLPTLAEHQWFTLALLANGTPKDIELALRLLRIVADNNSASRDSTPVAQIIFFTADKSEFSAGLIGLVRTFRLEHPSIALKHVRYEKGALFKAVLAAQNALAPSGKIEEEISVDAAGTVSVPRLHRSRVEAGTPLALPREGTYVISGGLGALGLVVAKFLVDRGATNVVLLSRDIRANDLPAEVIALGRHATIECISCDVTKKDDVQAVCDWISNANWPAVRGVVHAAGILTGGLIGNQSAEDMRLAFATKVHGAQNLKAICNPSDFLLLFSSVSVIFGCEGLASYTMANAAMDALALSWSEQGENVLSIQWGAWSEGGMAVQKGAVERIQRAGYGIIDNTLGTALLEHLLASGKTGVVCASPVEWKKIAVHSARFEKLSDRIKTHRRKAHKPDTWNLDALQQLVETSVLPFLPDDTAALNTEELRQQAFMELGLSSLDLVQFRQQLVSSLPDSVDLPVHFAFNYPTTKEVAMHLFEQLESKGLQNSGPTRIWTLLNGQTEGTPIFLVGGMMGSVEKTFGPLAELISVPVYGTMPAIPAVIDPAKTTLESIASELCHALLTEVPCGSYTLGGFSFGAALAFEMGIQLEHHNRLTRLIMLDPRHLAPFTSPPNPVPFEILLERYIPSQSLQAPTLVFQCTIPPIKNQSEMMREASRSFQSDGEVWYRCRDLCPALEVVHCEGHHFNYLYKHGGPIAARIER